MGLPTPEVRPSTMATPKLKARGKGVVTKHHRFPGYEPVGKPEVKITKCIGFQKFRYFGENRPGKKYQDKDFLQLALYHLSGKNVRIQIVCFDAEREDQIHPNGLVGRDCEHGVYTKVFPISKTTQIVRIPYLRTERILTKKTQKEEKSKISTVFEERAKLLPSPYNGWCLQQSKLNQKYDTTRVCFGIIVTIENEDSAPLFCLSNVVQNASEKTTLQILKLSTQYVSAQEGGLVDIFTSEDGPPITAGKCAVQVVTQKNGETYWESAEYYPPQDQILYKRVVAYRVPAFEPNPATDTSVRATIKLSCIQSGQTCAVEFFYDPGADSARRVATMHSHKPLRKRPYVPDPADDLNSVKVPDADSVKRRVKEKVERSRQEMEAAYVQHKTEPADLSMPISVSNEVTVPNAATPYVAQEKVPLHEQDDIVLAKDLVTGEVVYIRTQSAQSSSDVVVYVQDAQQALASSDGFTTLTVMSDSPRMATSELSSTDQRSAQVEAVRVLESAVADQHGVNRAARTSAAKKNQALVNPWTVDADKNTGPLVNGDIAFSNPKLDNNGQWLNSQPLKREPGERGPPILHRRSLNINSENVPGVSNNLQSGTLVSSTNLTSGGNIFSLGSLFANGVLEGVQFDDSGTLLSSSVIDMISPYM